MKAFVRLYVLPVFLFATLFLSLPVASKGPAAPSSIESGTTTQITANPEVTENKNSDYLLGVATVANAAIHTAENSVDLMLKIISMISIFIAIIAGTLGVFGFRSMRATKNKINAAVKKQIDDLHVEINKQHKIISEASRCMIFTTNAMHEWQVAANLTNSPTDREEDEKLKLNCLQMALKNLDQVTFSAKGAGNITVETWAYSMKAYICKRMNMLNDAIRNAVTAMIKTIDYIQKFEENRKAYDSYDESLINDLKDKLPSRYFNVACYYCLDNNKDKSIQYLIKAITADPSYKIKAPSEKDLENLWEDENFKDLII